MSLASRFSAIAACAGLAVIGTSGPAHAWKTFECDGDVEGIRSNVTFFMNRCSIEFGSAREGVVLYAVNEWNRLLGVQDRFGTAPGNTNCTIDEDDDRFDVAFATPEQIDGAAGLMSPETEACIWPYPGAFDGEVTEAAVYIADNLPLQAIGELSSSLGARETAVHEFGHVLGMEHVDDRMTVMCTSGTCGKYGARDAISGILFNNTESLHPDDVHFMARWHGSSGGGVDIGASAWTNIASSFQLNHPTLQTFVACPGQAVSVTFSHGIKGKNHVPSTAPFPARIVFSSNDVISGEDTTGLSFSVFGNRGQFFTNTAPVTVPALPPGTYELGLLIDPTGAKPETDEGNNSTRLNRRVTVPSGCP
jgi:hypothetical protein